MRSRRWHTLAATPLVVAVLAAPVSAAVSPPAGALFEEGRRLLAAGNTAEACARLSESFALDPSSGTLLNLALCHETLGRTSTAWTEYREAARLARKQDRVDRALVAEQRSSALTPRVARLTVLVAASVPGLVVELDGHALGPGAVGMALPVDPGVRRVTAAAPQRQTSSATLDMREGEQRILEIPELAPDARVVAKRPPAVHDTEGARTSSLSAISSPQPDAASSSPLEVYSAAAGGALLVSGAVAWSIAYARFESAEDACRSVDNCADRSGRIATIQTLQQIAIVSWVSGGALLLVSGLHHHFRKSHTAVTVALDPVKRELELHALF